jgi:hypothetical protein
VVNLGITILILLVGAVTLGVEAMRLNKIIIVLRRKHEIAKELKSLGEEIDKLNHDNDGIQEDLRLLRKHKDELDYSRRMAEENGTWLRRQLVAFVHIVDSAHDRRIRARFRLDVITPEETSKDTRWFKHFNDFFHLADTGAPTDEDGLQAISMSPHIVNQFAVGRPFPADADTPQ